MKANEIQIGSHYKAKVSGNIVTVRVDDVGYNNTRSYAVTNLVTGKKLVFKSAQRFRSLATYVIPEPRQPKEPKFKVGDQVTINSGNLANCSLEHPEAMAGSHLYNVSHLHKHNTPITAAVLDDQGTFN